MKRSPTPSLLLELPLVVSSQQARKLRAHLEAARCLYNALLGEARKRLLQMRSDPAWQLAQRLPRACKKERPAAFSALREQYGFTEYALHAYARTARRAWIADHIDSTMAQTLATRAYQAVNRMCLGHACDRRDCPFRSGALGPESAPLL